MGTVDNRTAPRQAPPEQPQHLHDTLPASRWQAWRRLFDEALGVALLLVLGAIAVAALLSLVLR